LRARARALARLRLIDFFDSERALSAASRSHSLYHFRHERARDRDRENREPLQRWLERRRDEDEAERGGGDASAFLARCVTRRKQRADGRRIMTIRSERKRDGAAMLVIARRRNWIGLLARASERERARQRVHARIIKRLFELVPVSISLDNTRLDHRRCFPREDECPVTRSADDARLRGGNIDRPCLPRREISFFAAIPSVRRGNKRSPLRAGSSRFSRNSTLWRQNVEARGAKCRSQGFRGVIFSVISDCEIRALFPDITRTGTRFRNREGPRWRCGANSPVMPTGNQQVQSIVSPGWPINLSSTRDPFSKVAKKCPRNYMSKHECIRSYSIDSIPWTGKAWRAGDTRTRKGHED